MPIYKVYIKVNDQWNTQVGSVTGNIIGNEFVGTISALNVNSGITKGNTYMLKTNQINPQDVGRYHCQKGGVKVGDEVKMTAAALLEEAMSLGMYQEPALAATAYQVNITMDADTVQALLGAGFNLYAFKAVQTANQGGAPLVWFKTDIFSVNTHWSLD